MLKPPGKWFGASFEAATGWLLALPRGFKRAVALVFDVGVCVWSVWAAYYLRLGEWIAFDQTRWLAVIVAVVLAIPIFVTSGFYRAIFRHAGLPAMLAIARAGLIYGFCYSAIFTFWGVNTIPRTLGLIQPVLLFLIIAGSRGLTHYLLGGRYRRIVDLDEAPRAMIYGAGASGRQLAAALATSREMRVRGFFDDDPSLHGGTIAGVRVYDPADIPRIVERERVSEVLLAIPSASRTRRLTIIASLRAASVAVRTLPGLSDLARGRFTISDIRPLDIEDLLGRVTVAPDHRLLQRNITGKRVMVTGAGGSIGSELCRQLLALEPSHLILVEVSEFALYAVHTELEKRLDIGQARTELVAVLGSVRDHVVMSRIFAKFAPETVYHAAAYKHVPLVEQNILEGIANNALGTETVARVAKDYNVSDFVLISSDKAVRPTNVMGATKRLAELFLQSLAMESDTTRFSMVRFGNVLDSSGSVVPLFRQQIAAGGPVTLTHPEVTRYFMTIPEAAQLVIQAGTMARGGEVFVLDMGEPVLIRHLARTMIELSGLTVRDSENPDGDIELQLIGLRPGEKLYEELLIGNDPQPTAHSRIMQAREACFAPPELERLLLPLRGAIAASDSDAAMKALRRLVPDYFTTGTPSDISDETPVAADFEELVANG